MSERFIFINSHPIQYFAPLYKYMNENGLPASAWYCSDENVKGHLDRQFNSVVKWDIPLLEGYDYRFFKNYSWKPSLYNGFFGLFNPGLLRALIREKKSNVVVHGWGYLTNILVIIIGRLAGHKVLLRGESPLNQELLKGKLNHLVKQVLLRGLLFRFVNRFLYIGNQNKAFYKFYSVSDQKLLFAPYAVDNDRFRKSAENLISLRNALRTELGLPANDRLILFTAKYINKKRPLDLLAAFQKMQRPGVSLVMVGDGELRNDMETFIKLNSLSNVFLTGFINQTAIENYYAVSDVFVLSSGEGETWGLSVNEAMNFNLPVVVSDMAGCSSDLVRSDKNGFVFPVGDIDALADALNKALKLTEVRNTEMINTYSFQTITNSLKTL